MDFLLKHKDKIVSFGLLPTIITLIGLDFFPTTEMLQSRTGYQYYSSSIRYFSPKRIEFLFRFKEPSVSAYASLKSIFMAISMFL